MSQVTGGLKLQLQQTVSQLKKKKNNPLIFWSKLKINLALTIYL